MKIRIEIQGTSPLLMHNPRMADPEYDVNRQMKAITAKRKKTDDDLAAIAKLEWFGGIYTMNMNGAGTEIVSQPTSKVRKCLVNAAKISKKGRHLERALSFMALDVPLIYKGPKTLEELFKIKDFHSRLSVGVGGKRIMRVRPRFFPWALSLEGLLIEDAGINFDELISIAQLAGQCEGIGDNRVNGYGRFTVKVTKL